MHVLKSTALVCAFLATLAVYAQKTPDSSQTASDSSASATSLKVYENQDLNLVFSYPQDLQPEDAKTIGERGHIAIYGDQPKNDPEHTKSEACDKVLLMVGKVSDPNKKSLTITDNKSISVSPDPGGSVLLVEVDPSCIPPKYLKKMDNLLAAFASQIISFPGMTPIDQPLWYEIQKHRIHFAAAQGRPIAKALNEASNDPQIVAGFAVEARGHVLIWMLQSNNVDFFNRLLDSRVSFGSGSPQPLFPEHLH